MKKLIIAAIMAIAFLSSSAFAQVKPTPTANHHTTTPRTPLSNPDAMKTRGITPVQIAQRVITSRAQVWRKTSSESRETTSSCKYDTRQNWRNSGQ